MKTNRIILTLALGTALIAFAGCKKKETVTTGETPPTPTMGDQMKAAATNVAAETKEVATQAVEKTKEVAGEVADKTKEVAGEAADKAKAAGTAVKEGTQNAVAEVKEAVKGTNDAAASSAQDLIDKAKALVADSKYKEAMDTLQGLANFKLTDEQQKVVDDLKEQIQKGLSAAGVSNLLGK